MAVNSEANARRISMVESCFGSSGQVIIINDSTGDKAHLFTCALSVVLK